MHGVRIVAVQAGRLPHRQAGRELAQLRRRCLISLVCHRRIGVCRYRPAGFLVAGQAVDVRRLIESTTRWRILLKAFQAEELVRRGNAQVDDVRIVAGATLNLA